MSGALILPKLGISAVNTAFSCWSSPYFCWSTSRTSFSSARCLYSSVHLLAAASLSSINLRIEAEKRVARETRSKAKTGSMTGSASTGAMINAPEVRAVAW